MTKEQAIQILKDKLAAVKPDHSEDEIAFEYMGEIEYAIKQIEAGADIEEAMGNV